MTSQKKTSSRLPFLLGGVVFLMIAAYCVYWFVMAGELRKGVDTWVNDQRAAGHTVTYSKMKLGGFPYRFSLRVNDPVIASPVEGWSWAGTELTLVAQTYNLQHLLAFSPEKNVFKVEGQPDTMISPGPKSVASLKFDAAYNLTDFGLTVPTAKVEHGDATAFQVNDLGLSLNPMPDNADNLKFKLAVKQISIDKIDDDLVWLGPTADELIVWLEVEKFYPLIRNELSETEWRQAGNKLHLRRGQVDWGPLDLATKASVRLDDNLDPNGTIGVHLERTNDLKSALQKAGKLTDEANLAISAFGFFSNGDKFVDLEVRERSIYAFDRRLTSY